MIDFLSISETLSKNGVLEISPDFEAIESNDLMIRGQDFYAIWLEDKKRWSKNPFDAVKAIDKELDNYYEQNKDRYSSYKVKVLHLRETKNRKISRWHQFCKEDMRDRFHELDDKLIFSNDDVSKFNYASKCLPYPLEEGDISAYDELMSTLYSPEERHKLEWAIGAVITGESKYIQKFIVIYGSSGTGKSTFLTILEKLLGGSNTENIEQYYWKPFDAKKLASNSSFPLESLSSNPLVAIQHDGDLSRIEDNTILNSVVSHETLSISEKYLRPYPTRFKSFLFMASNKPVKITDAKSGIIRRLIDVTPSGNLITPKRKYDSLMKKIDFELGAIAYYCKEVFLKNPDYYDNYVPLSMMSATNDFYNFMLYHYNDFEEKDGVSQKVAWDWYKMYCDEARVPNPLPNRPFKEELKNYFDEYYDRITLEDGSRPWNYYKGFKKGKFRKNIVIEKLKDAPLEENLLLQEYGLIEQESLFDKLYADCPAQYANGEDKPTFKWENVKTKLKDLDTSRVHFVLLPEANHIVMDFDLKDEQGNKSLILNLKAAAKYPDTYTELSKSGVAVHKDYIYDGDIDKLALEAEPGVEIKTFSGKMSLRRRLTKCNSLKIAHINSGLPLREERKKMINFNGFTNDKAVYTTIRKHLNKEIFGSTVESINGIYNDLERAYKQEGLSYNIPASVRDAIFSFASKSTHHSADCMKLCLKMKLQSKDYEEKQAEELTDVDRENTEVMPIVFFDCEVFPNLVIVNYKFEGPNNPVIRLINPKPTDISYLRQFRLVGFNCRRYDNHILYGIELGLHIYEIYQLSQSIISGDKDAFYKNAEDYSYLDLYDVASTKQSLKKWEIQLDIHHQELGLPWDQPVPEELWEKVAIYCDYDVIATEAVYHAIEADIDARKMLSAVTGLSVNSTTNQHTTRLIFGTNRNPQSEFNYRNMADTSDASRFVITKDGVAYDNFGDEYTMFDSKGRPVFPGYTFEIKKTTDTNGLSHYIPTSTYRGEEIGEGGKVYAEPGMYTDVALLDIASMHPHSIIAEELFGPKYTKRFADLVNTRIAIKHHDYELAKTYFDGAFKDFLEDESLAEKLAFALKIAINSVYGLTSASFKNAFKDPRNVDNIVAKRGALFMTNLKFMVQSKGFTVAHIKTDSIKIPNATPEIIEFVKEYGKLYGYTFEHEATYDRMCLVNDAVYIARYATVEKCYELYSKEYVESSKDCCKENKKHPSQWTATGTQFQIPYVFKKLFSKEEIIFKDLCETKSVTTALYLDMNEDLPEDKHNYVFVGKVGLFCPIKPGKGGGELLRESIDKKTGEKKYSYAVGAKGYRWLEASPELENILRPDVDESYYEVKAKEAIDTISEYGDFEQFVS